MAESGEQIAAITVRFIVAVWLEPGAASLPFNLRLIEPPCSVSAREVGLNSEHEQAADSQSRRNHGSPDNLGGLRNISRGGLLFNGAHRRPAERTAFNYDHGRTGTRRERATRPEATASRSDRRVSAGSASRVCREHGSRERTVSFIKCGPIKPRRHDI